MSIEDVLAAVTARADELLAETIRIAEIPAPPFQEGARSAYIAERFRAIGLQKVHIDHLGNVTGRRPGAEGSPTVMVVSHIDTVFPAGTDVRVRVEGARAYGPGISDNSMALASLINLVPALDQAGYALPCNLILAASVGEEGLGDLRGMRQLMADWQGKVDAVVVYDGNVGGVVWGGVGSRRLRVHYKAAGGHSFGDFGNPSAIHGLVTACARFAALPVPEEPKTTLNIGTIKGGTSINAIAEEAEAFIDMRSVGTAELEMLVGKAVRIFERTATELGCTAEITTVGDRPAGALRQDHPLVKLAVDVLTGMRIKPQLSISSTDANVAFALGIPAVCIGSGIGMGAHTLGEYLEIPSLVPGLQQLVQVLARLDWATIRG
ncbi:MAG TPA: M20/M25/M40 family metallo-hydrolase [Symbiobacteriaceae bacterium]|nr:M20/M25/M40 family metallo-hydrolase [Symbiobacteriaceae bacterium]